jgi:hypothetical protein
MTITRSVDTRWGEYRWGATKTGKGRTIRLPVSVVDVLARDRELPHVPSATAKE